MKLIPKHIGGKALKVIKDSGVKISKNASRKASKSTSNLDKATSLVGNMSSKNKNVILKLLGLTLDEYHLLANASRNGINPLLLTPGNQEAVKFLNAYNKFAKKAGMKEYGSMQELANEYSYRLSRSKNINKLRAKRMEGASKGAAEGEAAAEKAAGEAAATGEAAAATEGAVEGATSKLVPKRTLWQRSRIPLAAVAGATALYSLWPSSAEGLEMNDSSLMEGDEGGLQEYPTLIETTPPQYIDLAPVGGNNPATDTTPQKINPSIINRLQPTQQPVLTTTTTENVSEYPLQTRGDIRRMFKSKGVKNTVDLVRAIEGDSELKKATMSRLGMTSWDLNQALQKLNQLGIYGSIGGSDRKRFRTMLNRGFRNGGTLYKLVPRCK